jgi:transcriptional regulator with XRE-family HTH domain
MSKKLDSDEWEELVPVIQLEINKKQISLRSIARNVGMSHAYLSELLNNKKQPSFSVASELAEYLGIPWSQFLQLSGKIGDNEEEILLLEIEETVKEDPMLKNIFAEILNLDDDKRKKALDAFNKVLSEIK